MQLFRPYHSHRKSAQFICDLRLNKQVVECFQISRSILIHMGILNGRGGYFQHPITQLIWNEGRPFLPDLCQYMNACDLEWRLRGKNRSQEFTEKMLDLERMIYDHRERFDWGPMPPFYISGDTRIIGEERAFMLYRELLAQKWRLDKRAPKCSLPKEQAMRG